MFKIQSDGLSMFSDCRGTSSTCWWCPTPRLPTTSALSTSPTARSPRPWTIRSRAMTSTRATEARTPATSWTGRACPLSSTWSSQRGRSSTRLLRCQPRSLSLPLCPPLASPGSEENLALMDLLDLRVPRERQEGMGWTEWMEFRDLLEMS